MGRQLSIALGRTFPKGSLGVKSSKRVYYLVLVVVLGIPKGNSWCVVGSSSIVFLLSVCLLS